MNSYNCIYLQSYNQLNKNIIFKDRKSGLKMSMISQSTQDSSSGSIDSETRNTLRSRYYDSLDSVQQRLDYTKAIPEAGFKQRHIQNPVQPINKSYIILAGLLIISIIIPIWSFQINSKPQPETSLVPIIPNNNKVEKVLDPIAVTYIKSYQESAMAKYYYYDLLAEYCFNQILEKLKTYIWLEEELIKEYISNQFNEIDSYIIQNKVWRLKNKSDLIVVELNLNDVLVWRYKNCNCTCE